MSVCGSGMGCGVVEWVQRNALRWFGHVQRMENEEFVKEVYLSSVEGSSRRVRPLRKWEDWVKEYMSDRGVRFNPLSPVACYNYSPLYLD